jgi:magnesium transporter
LLRSTGRLLGVAPRRGPHLVERRGRVVGREPGSLDRTPDAAPAVISVFSYEAEGELHESHGVSPENAAALAGAAGVTWIDVEGTADTTAISTIGDAFGLHPLVQEDLSHPQQRPKLESYGDDRLFVVLRMVNPLPNAEADVLVNGGHDVEQVGFILCPNHVLSFQEGVRGDAFEPVRARLRTRAQRFRELGPDYLLYALLDVIVDQYFVTLERIGDATESFEEQVFRRPTPALLAAVQSLRREAIVIRRAIWPLREVLSALTREEHPLITDRTRLYLRDVHDHVIQAVDTVEIIRDVLEGIVDHYLSALTYRTNEVMRVLTVVGTIFLPLTFITSIYGMNFDPHASRWNMPELLYPYGYPIVLAVLLIVGVWILLAFRRRGFLGQGGGRR